MILQTHISLQKETYNPITYDSKVCLLGSCFSENMGDKLSYYKFQTLQNPVGILFHPKAIAQFISRVVNKEMVTENDVFHFNEHWHSFEIHSALSDVSKENLLAKLNKTILQTFEMLQQASHVIITLGTAWAYRHVATDTIVANCHKVPQKQFLKELLPVDEIAESIESTIALLRMLNPKVTVLLTVSPVRHLKDGFVENQLSKAHLLAGIHQVVEVRKQIHYFPSYELLMDELRDYRFYKADMIHPNATAIQYIWEKFTHAWIAHESETTMKEVEYIQKGLAHKPFHPNSEAHQKFLLQLREKITQLQAKIPYISF